MKAKQAWLAVGGVLVLALIAFFTTQQKKDTAKIPGGMPTSAPPAADDIAGDLDLNKNNMQETTENSQQELSFPAMQIDPRQQYWAVLNTEAGPIKIRLQAGQTPKTVNNFIYLINQGFYEATTFHRVIEGFMIQGGDPKGDGSGGPGYQFADEPFEGEYNRGTVAMANSGPDTNGSQFFIMHQDRDLPKNYVIFGQVVEGMETVDKIASAPVETVGGENSRPVNPVQITSAQVITE